MRRLFLAAVCAVLIHSANRAADVPAEAPTIMSDRGKLLFSDDLNQPFSKDWQTAKGKWEVVDGSMRGAELKSDMHGAVSRHALPAQNVIVQYSFKLDGARGTTLSINDDKGHCCRVLFAATGFTLQKDSHDHNMKDKPMVLDKKEAAIKPGEWHTIVIEIQGKDMVARLDGKTTGFGSHDSIDVMKKNLGLTIAGETVSFKNLRVWEATPKKDWPATKAKLMEERGKAGK